MSADIILQTDVDYNLLSFLSIAFEVSFNGSCTELECTNFWQKLNVPSSEDEITDSSGTLLIPTSHGLVLFNYNLIF